MVDAPGPFTIRGQNKVSTKGNKCHLERKKRGFTIERYVEATQRAEGNAEVINAGQMCNTARKKRRAGEKCKSSRARTESRNAREDAAGGQEQLTRSKQGSSSYYNGTGGAPT